MLTFWNTNGRIGRSSEYVCGWYGVGLDDSSWKIEIDGVELLDLYLSCVSNPIR
jgi:hypothetical protein